MRPLRISLVLGLAALALHACGVEASAPARITLLTDDGRNVDLTPGPRIVVYGMGSWCPYSKQFVRFLADPSVKQLTGELEMLFVFEDDEWPVVEKQLAEMAATGEIKQAEIPEYLSQLRSISGHRRVVEPVMLDSLPGPFYFLPPNSSIRMDEGVPSTLDLEASAFNEHPLEWLAERFPGSKSTIVAAWDRAEER
jgi:hypothetical protein